jgi:hypothetical protein
VALRRFVVSFIIGVAGVTGLGGQVSAIDVKPSADTTAAVPTPSVERPQTKTFLTAPVKSEPGLLDKLKRQVREAKPATEQQYDDYIDADGDGVDDRLAKQAKVKEQTEKTKPAAAAPEHRTRSKKSVKPAVPPKEKP